MAYTPLAIQVLRRETLTISGTTFSVTTPVAGAQLELVNQLTGASANMLTRQGAIIATPVLTDTAGRAQVWVVNGIYEYRTVDPDTGLAVEDWAAFPAYRGRGAEDIVGVSLAENLPTASVLTMPNHGVENTVGSARVTMTFDHDHMGDVTIMLVPPWDATLSRPIVGLPTAALSGGVPLEAAEAEFRDAATLAPLTLYDAQSGGSVITPPYLTDANGNFDAYHQGGALLFQSRVTASDNLTDWVPVQRAEGAAIVLWNGPENIGFGMTDFAFDGTVTFAPAGGDNSAPFADGDTVGSTPLSGSLGGFASDGTWTLWIAGGTPGSPGELASWAIELVPV